MKPLSDYVAELGFVSLIDKIFEATRKLDEVSGYAKVRAQTRSAVSACIAAFNFVLYELQWRLRLPPDRRWRPARASRPPSRRSLIATVQKRKKRERKRALEEGREGEATDEEPRRRIAPPPWSPHPHPIHRPHPRLLSLRRRRGQREVEPLLLTLQVSPFFIRGEGEDLCSAYTQGVRPPPGSVSAYTTVRQDLFLWDSDHLPE